MSNTSHGENHPLKINNVSNVTKTTHNYGLSPGVSSAELDSVFELFSRCVVTIYLKFIVE